MKPDWSYERQALLLINGNFFKSFNRQSDQQPDQKSGAALRRLPENLQKPVSTWSRTDWCGTRGADRMDGRVQERFRQQ